MQGNKGLQLRHGGVRLTALGLPANKVLHLGRNIGAKWLDCVEVDAAEVKRMGQWNQSIYEKAYEF